MISHFEQLPGEPIFVATLPQGYRMETDFKSEAYLALLDEVEEPVYWIVDTRQWMFDFQQLLLAANQLARGEHSLYHHPNMKQVLYVANSDILPAIAQGLSSDEFGHVNVQVFSTLNEAVDYARADYAASK